MGKMPNKNINNPLTSNMEDIISQLAKAELAHKMDQDVLNELNQSLDNIERSIDELKAMALADDTVSIIISDLLTENLPENLPFAELNKALLARAKIISDLTEPQAKLLD